MTRTVNDDARDLAAARAGGQEAFARLFDRHGPVVLSMCRGRTRAEAEDATQETFLRAWTRLDTLDRPEHLRPWLYAIARRVCAERNRARRRRAAHEERWRMIASNASNDHPARGNGAERAARAAELDRLGAALERLDERERLALHLHYLDQDPLEAAGSLGLSRSGYYKLLARARANLGALMNTPANVT